MIKLDISGIDLDAHEENFRRPILKALGWLSSAPHPERFSFEDRRLSQFGRRVMDMPELGGSAAKEYCAHLYAALSAAQYPMSVEDMLDLVRQDQVFRIMHGWRRLDQLHEHTRTPREMVACQKCLRTIFSYEAFSSSSRLEWNDSEHKLIARPVSDGGKWGAFEFLSELYRVNHLSCCPYCNADYVYAVQADDGNACVRTDIDHFFPRWKYPYLALCLRNLVPSCARCNSRFKKGLDVLAHNHPVRKRKTYDENLSLTAAPVLAISNPYCDDLHYSIRFELQDVSLEMLLGQVQVSDPHLNCFTVKGRGGDRFGASVKLFHLQSVYRQIYGRELKEMPLRIGIAMSEYPNMIVSAIREWSGLCNLDDRKLLNADNLRRLLLNGSLCPEKINDERLGKLKFDIYEQLCGFAI